MTNKITKKEMFKMIRELAEVQARAEMVDFIDHEIALLEKKANGKKTPTKVQEANLGIKEVIVNVLMNAEPMTISEMQKANEELGQLSNQKISALAKQLVESGQIVRTTDKKTARFSLVETE